MGRKGKLRNRSHVGELNLRYGFWSEGSDEATQNEGGISKIEEEGELLENSGLLEETSDRSIFQGDTSRTSIV